MLNNKVSKENVVDILKDILEDFEMSDDRFDEDLKDYGFDSLSFIRLIVFIEDEFDIEIPDDILLLDEMDTINKIYNVIYQEINKN